MNAQTSPPPLPPKPARRRNEGQPPKDLTGQEAYNIVSDTVTGINFRFRDNVIQGIGIAASVVIGITIGALVSEEPEVGAFLGGIAGVVLGLVLSGALVMIYRTYRHVRGHHD